MWNRLLNWLGAGMDRIEYMPTGRLVELLRTTEYYHEQAGNAIEVMRAELTKRGIQTDPNQLKLY